jgi:hypothetical protein
MPRVRFIKRLDWPSDGKNRRQTIAYLPGMRELVTTPCAEFAVANGYAVVLDPPAEPTEPIERNGESEKAKPRLGRRKTAED